MQPHPVLCLIVFGICSVPASATTIHVPADQPTIQDGINAAVDGDTVLVEPGTYFENVNFGGKSITVRGSDGAESTIIDADDVGAAVHFPVGGTLQSVLWGFTLQNGSGPGGLTVINSQATIVDCRIENNFGVSFPTGNAGGGVTATNADLVMLGCSIRNNKSMGQVNAFAGGIRGNSGSEILLINCEVTDNEVVATPAAGGTLQTFGAAMYLNQAEATLINCTVANNFGTPCSAAIVHQSSTLTVKNSVFALNCGNLFQAPTTSVTHTCASPLLTGEGNIASNPSFLNSDKGDYRLSSNSPCRDAASLAALLADELDLDADGDTKELIPLDAQWQRRIVNGFVDMGASEWQRTCLADISPSSPGVAGDGTINVDDLLTVINAWGECDICVADVNGDNPVNVDDLLAIINGWGSCK